MKNLGRIEYVLVTPARNEAQFIEVTIQSMIAQTHPPLRWVIVSDGSTDRTDEIVGKYLVDYPWIELVRMSERKERHFAGKVHAFNAGVERIRNLQFDVIGNLDADVSFGPRHFELLIDNFASNSNLGVAGTSFREGTFQYNYRFSSIENVWGGCQLFRRDCFEAIGGYIPLKGGCIDHVAVVSARMRGWETRTFTDSVCTHHRKMGTARQGVVKAWFKLGGKDYSVGNHPLWEIARALYQMKNPPYFLGGLILFGGYIWPWIRGRKSLIPRELRNFLRREQMRRLRQLSLGR